MLAGKSTILNYPDIFQTFLYLWLKFFIQTVLFNILQINLSRLADLGVLGSTVVSFTRLGEISSKYIEGNTSEAF